MARADRPAATRPEWRNRIVGEGEEAPDQILGNPQNFRVHPAHQQEAMAGVLDEIGVIQRVIVNKRTGHLVDGHLRVQLALRSGVTKIPVLYVDLSEAEERLALATLDPIAALAETDRAVLGQLLGDLEHRPAALKGLLDGLAKQAGGIDQEPRGGATDPDAVPPLPGKPVSQAGDLWILGDHRLAVGDATLPAAYEQVLAGELVDAVWTDPPYNVAIDGKAGKIANDDMPRAAFAAFLQHAFAQTSASLKAGGAYYVAHSDSERPAFQAALEANEMPIRQCLIWVKNSGVLSRQDYNWRHEPILYGWREGAAHYFGFDFTANTVIDTGGADVSRMSREALEALAAQLLAAVPTSTLYVDRPARSELHPKPVELIERCLAHSTRPGETVLDPFGGSGSTLMACERLRRRARLLELDPRYADVIVRRWQEYTQGEPVLQRSGQRSRKAKRRAAA